MVVVLVAWDVGWRWKMATERVDSSASWTRVMMRDGCCVEEVRRGDKVEICSKHAYAATSMHDLSNASNTGMYIQSVTKDVLQYLTGDACDR